MKLSFIGCLLPVLSCYIGLQAEVLDFDVDNVKSHYRIVDSIKGHIKPRNGMKIHLFGKTEAAIECKQPSSGRIEITIKRVFSDVTFRVKQSFKYFQLDVPELHARRGFPKKFASLLHKLANRKIVFEMQPTGEVIEITKTLQILQKIRIDSRDSLAKRLVISPVNHFFLQLRHLAAQNLQKKTHRLPISSFFLGMQKPKDTSRPICYTFKKVKGQLCEATVKGSKKITQNGAKASVSVHGKVRWKKSNPHFQKRYLLFTNSFSDKNAKVYVKTQETWKSKSVKGKPRKGLSPF